MNESGVMERVKERKSAMQRLVQRPGRWGVVLLFWMSLSACMTPEAVQQEEEQVVVEASSGEERFYPDWFQPNREGGFSGGELFGQGRAVASDLSVAREKAREHAVEGARYRLDALLDRELDRVEAEWQGDGALRPAVRRAVASISFEQAEWRMEEVPFPASDGRVYVAEVRIPVTEIASRLSPHLEGIPVEMWLNSISE